MNTLLIIASFVATGSAWAMAWLGGCGTLRKDMYSGPLMKLVSILFVIAGSISAGYILYQIYGKYSSDLAADKEFMQNYFSGKNLIINGGRLLIQFSPLALILPGLRRSKIICGVVGTCYVLLPYYNRIIGVFVS